MKQSSRDFNGAALRTTINELKRNHVCHKFRNLTFPFGAGNGNRIFIIFHMLYDRSVG